MGYIYARLHVQPMGQGAKITYEIINKRMSMGISKHENKSHLRNQLFEILQQMHAQKNNQRKLTEMQNSNDSTDPRYIPPAPNSP